MSTTYPPRLIKYILSSKNERNLARTSSLTPSFYGDFPHTFGLYYSGPGKDFLSQRFYLEDMHNVAAGAPRQPLYAITFHKGPGSFQITLYSTPHYDGVPMSIATNERRYGSSVNITLPGDGEDNPRTERLQYEGFRLNSYTFSLDGETFQFQEDNTKRPKVRRIIWLNTGSSQNSHISGVKSTASYSSEHNENEIVAIWTEGSVPSRNGRVAIFQFTSSAMAQKLGKYWALLAVSSMLAICQQGGAIENLGMRRKDWSRAIVRFETTITRLSAAARIPAERRHVSELPFVGDENLRIQFGKR